MEADVQTDASSASPLPPDASGVLASLSPAETQEWRKTGALPDRSETADSTPAEPVAQAASTDASLPAASEPAKPTKRKGADARIDELLADRARERERSDRLEKELAALRSTTKPDAPAASSPAVAAKPVEDAEPDPTNLEKYPDGQYDRQFLKDQSRWEARQELKARDAQLEEQASHRAFVEHEQQRVEGFKSRMEAAGAADPTFFTRLAASKVGQFKTTGKAAMDGERKTVDHFIADALVGSELSTELLSHLMDDAHAANLAYLQAAANPNDVTVRVARLEGRLERAGATPPPKKVSNAPAPPVFLGSRTATVADPADDARKRNDVGAYLAAMNAREFAAAKGK